MKEGVENSVKFKKLKRRLRLPEWQVIGLLESIWKLCRTSAQAGDIGRFDNEDIAASIEYQDDADELITVLIECGWLDEDAEFRLIVHDWSDHVPSYMKGNFAKHGKLFADQVAKQRETAPVEVAKQGATKPNLTKPSQAKPNQANTPCSPPKGDDCSVQDFFDRWNRFADRTPKVAKCRKLTPERRKKLKSRLSETGWLQDFEESVKSLPLSGDGWQPTLDWLIKNGHNIYRLLEGDFDWRNKDDPAADRLAKKRRENAYAQRQEHEARQKAERERTAKRSRQTIEKAVGQASLLSEPPKADREQRTQREIEEALRNA